MAYLVELENTNPLVTNKVGGITEEGRNIVQTIISSDLQAKSLFISLTVICTPGNGSLPQHAFGLLSRYKAYSQSIYYFYHKLFYNFVILLSKRYKFENTISDNIWIWH